MKSILLTLTVILLSGCDINVTFNEPSPPVVGIRPLMGIAPQTNDVNMVAHTADPDNYTLADLPPGYSVESNDQGVYHHVSERGWISWTDYESVHHAVEGARKRVAAEAERDAHPFKKVTQ